MLAVVVDADADAVTAVDTKVATGTSPSTPAVLAVPDGRFVVAWAERVEGLLHYSTTDWSSYP